MTDKILRDSGFDYLLNEDNLTDEEMNIKDILE
jgi:hypothetical protein